MLLYLLLLRTSVITDVTFESHFSFMNWCKMSIHVPLLRTSVVTNVTFEWLPSLMDRFNMFDHATLFRIAAVTNVTFEWPNPLPRRKRDWIFHHVVAKPQVVKNKIPHESRVALPRVTNGEFYPIPFSPWWRTDIPILHTKFWISILHMWGIDIAWFNFSTVETISIPHTWGIDRAWLF